MRCELSSKSLTRRFITGFVILIGAALPASVWSATDADVMILKRGGYFCRTKEHLGIIREVQSKYPSADMREVMRKAWDAAGGRLSCMPATDDQKVWLHSELSDPLSGVVCFTPWDSLNDHRPRSSRNALCAAAADVTTIDRLVAERSGSFVLTEILSNAGEVYWLVAMCDAGGRIAMSKIDGSWKRSSTIEIAAPHYQRSLPIPVSRPQEGENALSEEWIRYFQGICKGVEFIPAE